MIRNSDYEIMLTLLFSKKNQKRGRKIFTKWHGGGVLLVGGLMDVNISTGENILRNDETLYHYYVENKLVREVFERYPKNNQLEEVLMKVSLLNAFYSTNIEKHTTLLLMAKYIVKLAQESNLDDLIASGKQEAIDLIKNLDGNNFISFASKYCCNSNMDGYYIYDSLVRRRIYEYFRDNKCGFEKVSDKRLKNDYSFYCKVLSKYIELNNLKGTKREIDWDIWGNEKLKKLKEKIK